MKDPLIVNRDELDEGKCITVNVKDGQFEKEVFIVKYKSKYFAYENSCPHTGSPLDWMPNQFLNLDKTHIQCSTHHALFNIDNGLCVSGPCSGQSLKKIVLRESERGIELDI